MPGFFETLSSALTPWAQDREKRDNSRDSRVAKKTSPKQTWNYPAEDEEFMQGLFVEPFRHMRQLMDMAEKNFGDLDSNKGGGLSYCASSYSSYATDEQGRPQVYQKLRQVKSGPDGFKETKSAVSDSRTGHQELAVGHHLRDKAHVKKKLRNTYTGEEEQAEDFVNLDENEADSFEQNWARQAGNFNDFYHSNYLPYDRMFLGQSDGGNHNRGRFALTS